MATTYNYVRTGDRIALRFYDPDREYKKLFGNSETRWEVARVEGDRIVLAQVLNPSKRNGVRFVEDNAPDSTVAQFTGPKDIPAGQKIKIDRVEKRGEQFHVILERPLVGADTKARNANPFVELQNTLEGHVRAINALKAQLGSDMELRLTDNGRLAIVLIASIS